jgi:hypothetical protein
MDEDPAFVEVVAVKVQGGVAVWSTLPFQWKTPQNRPAMRSTPTLLLLVLLLLLLLKTM